MTFSRLKTIAAALLLSVVASAPFALIPILQQPRYQFEITCVSSVAGTAKIFYDLGKGFNDADSMQASVHGDNLPQRLQFEIPPGIYKGLRYEPIGQAGEVEVSDPMIRSPEGQLMRRFVLADFLPSHPSARYAVENGKLKTNTPVGETAPAFLIQLSEPLQLPWHSLRPKLVSAARCFLPFAVTIFVLVWLYGSQSRKIPSLWAWFAVRPIWAVTVVATIAVIASAYPLIFLGRSIVSPNIGTHLLYQDFPTLPGYTESHDASTAGADSGALMWAHLPYASVEAKALFHDHELPLWNRYNSAGTFLLGHGLSMFGDPLHFLILFSNDAAWAWDLKYLLAKSLLAVGIGLCVLRTTRHLPTALFMTAIVPFIGLFVYRINHPAIYSVCYAPWILLCWLCFATEADDRRAAVWLGGLMLANWSEINSGTVKEAYMSLLTLNGAGVMVLIFARLDITQRVRRLILAGVAGLIFVLLSAPVWLTFLDCLTQSFTVYDVPHAYQIRPSLALGFFDEIFFRPYNNGIVVNGSLNFLLLLGFLAFLVNLRRICSDDRIALALGLATLFPIMMIFGVIPPRLIVRLPFIGNLLHTDNSFFCPCITLWSVLAGYGFRAAVTRLAGPEGKGDLAIAALLLGFLVGDYFAFGQTVQRTAYPLWRLDENLSFDFAVKSSLIALIMAAVIFTLVAWRILLRRSASLASILVLVTCGFVLLWRHGLQARTIFREYVISPTQRVNLRARSEAVEAVQTYQNDEPGRVVGIGDNAWHGWMEMYGLEDICGADPLVPRRYRELEEAAGLEMQWAWRVYTTSSNLSAQKRLFDAFNVRYYFDSPRQPRLPGELLSLAKKADLTIYRSETAWPRAFFTNRVSTYSNANELARLISVGDGRPFASLQKGEAIPNEIAQTDFSSRVVVPATGYHFSNNKTSFEIEAPENGVVVLSETWLEKDFRAKLDGVVVPYLRINHAFKGVTIATPGKHQIEFEYWPRHFTIALVMAGLGTVALAVSALALWLHRKGELSPALI